MRSVLLSLGTAGCLLGCSLAVDVQRFRGAAAEPSDSSCSVRLFRNNFNLEGECEMIGRVKLRDTGFTVNCGSDRIREEVREAACELGGDAAVLHRVPSPISTCVQSDADIYRCASRAHKTGIEEPGFTDHEVE